MTAATVAFKRKLLSMGSKEKLMIASMDINKPSRSLIIRNFCLDIIILSHVEGAALFYLIMQI
jgi:hypothetical protein